jgi:hypothetical protein
MKFLYRVFLILVRVIVLIAIFYVYKHREKVGYTVKQGVVVGTGFIRTDARGGPNLIAYPIVAFQGIKGYEGVTSGDYDEEKLKQTYFSLGYQLPDTCGLYFTLPASWWSNSEHGIVGEQMEYYYYGDDFIHAQALSGSGYWFTFGNLLTLILVVIVWTAIVDLRRIAKKDKARLAEEDRANDEG